MITIHRRQRQKHQKQNLRIDTTNKIRVTGQMRKNPLLQHGGNYSRRKYADATICGGHWAESAKC